MLIIPKEKIQEVFSMRDAIESNKQAFRIYSNGESSVPLRTNIDISKYAGQSLFMPAYVESLNAIGIKIVSVFPQNNSKNLPVCPAEMLLMDGETGIIKAIIDGTYLTQIRTGAASGVATEVLSNKNSKIGALIGTGGQAFHQLEAMLEARPNLDEVRIFSRNQEKVFSFIDSATPMLSRFKAKLLGVTTSDDAIKDADIITLITTSKIPVINGDLVKKGAHINGVGSYTEEMHEIDEKTLIKASKIYVDSLSATLEEAGDLITPLKKNIISKNNITGEIGSLLLSNISGRKHADEITVFKTVGMAVMDIVAAHNIYNNSIK